MSNDLLRTAAHIAYDDTLGHDKVDRMIHNTPPMTHAELMASIDTRLGKLSEFKGAIEAWEKVIDHAREQVKIIVAANEELLREHRAERLQYESQTQKP